MLMIHLWDWLYRESPSKRHVPYPKEDPESNFAGNCCVFSRCGGPNSEGKELRVLISLVFHMALRVDGLRTKYPWTDANRLKLMEVVVIVKGEGRSQSLKWKEVARRVQNDSDMDDTAFGKLCAKQFDNLYRAYTKFKQDGDQPPRLTREIIKKFEELFPKTVAVQKTARKVCKIRGSLDIKSRAPGVMRGKPRGRKGHKLTWSSVARMNLLTAIRVAATKEGKIHWDEVVACMRSGFGISDERLCSLCMKQFTDLSGRYKDYKMAGIRPRRFTVEIIQNMDELYQKYPNLNPLPAGGQDLFVSAREEVAVETKAGNLVAPEHDLEYRSSSRQEATLLPEISVPEISEPSTGPAPSRPPTIPASAPAPCPSASASPSPIPTPTASPASGSSPSRTCAPIPPIPLSAPAPGSASTTTPLSSEDPAPILAPAADSNRGGSAVPASGDMATLRKRKERPDHADLSPPEDYKDDQEVGFDRVERELLQLKSWLKQEVLPVGTEVLSRVKAYGRRNHTGKSSKCDPNDDFDKLIYEASQKSTVLFIRAQFQQARANILKEVKDTIERVGMDLLHRRSSPFESSAAGFPDFKEGP